MHLVLRDDRRLVGIASGLGLALDREIVGERFVGDDDGSGVDSVLAAQVVARLRGTLQADLKLVHFLETPTIAAMAVKITQAALLTSAALEQMLLDLESLSDEDAAKLV